MAAIIKLIREAKLKIFLMEGNGVGAFLLAGLVLTALFRLDPGGAISDAASAIGTWRTK